MLNIITKMIKDRGVRPIEARLPYLGTYFVFPLVWLFLLHVLYSMINEHYYTIVHLSDDKGTAPYWIPVFWQIGSFLLQLSYRGIFWKKLHPDRHIFDGWILYTTSIISLVLAILIFAHGHWQGVLLLTYGGWMLQYVWRRPRYRSGLLLIKKLPMSIPNLWFQIWLSKYAHYTLAGLWFLTWITPWNFVVGFEWYEQLLDILRPYAPSLDVLSTKAENPSYAVSMNVAYLLLLPVSALIGLFHIQVGDHVASGELEARYARRYFVLCLAGLVFPFIMISYYLDGASYLPTLIRSHDMLLALFFTVELWSMNVCLLMVGSIILGWIRRETSKYKKEINHNG